eukprot:11720819-Ditylum_brightwellii.AAC.1
MYYQRKQPDVEVSVGINTKAREKETLEHASKDDESKDLPDTVALEEAKEANDGGGFEKFTTTRIGRVVRPNT